MSQQEEEKRKSRREKPVAPAYTGAQELFKLKKPVTPLEEQQEGKPAMQQDSAVEEKLENTEEGQKDETLLQIPVVTTTSQLNVQPVSHAESIPSENLTGQNMSMQAINPYGQQTSIPLKKSAGTQALQPRVSPAQQLKSQIVERRTVDVTIRIYEDQRREIEAMLTDRVNALIDAGVEVDRRKYQISVIYTELLDLALSLAKQQRQSR